MERRYGVRALGSRMPSVGEEASAPPLNRPRVIVSVTASADGRVALNRSSVLLDAAAGEVWQGLQPAGADELFALRRDRIERRQPQAVLEGSGTFVSESAEPPAELPVTRTELSTLLEHHLPGPTNCRWFVVVDGRGRIRWTYKGDDATRLLVLVSQSTPADYLAYLRHEEIPYLVAGTGQVDLALALSQLKRMLGVSCVISEAGGGLNGALLRAHLVDELHLILLPALIGGLDTPATFDGPPLQLGELPTSLRLIDVQSGGGAVWLSYAVVR